MNHDRYPDSYVLDRVKSIAIVGASQRTCGRVVTGLGAAPFAA